ncbi:hypothetical protein NUU61_005345 [Penicillium alfredii]|uniref:Helix-turn-helix domain-containing protein n=1 Tax=Penicillium alfredii TaxID=1506179 RepID=A0A9W9F9M1_9EURO|nr:uncharacterized protein NUU61_005345 [Penicillium alfredii]KAJ5095989.1 hypothetical protein NUU61_005345 [Penicillium alfredii]
MGSAASKPARSAAGAASRRQYPKQPPPPPREPAPAPKATKAPSPTSTPTPPSPSQAPAPAPATMSQGPIYHSSEQASQVKSSAIDLDGRDPDFAASLRSIGPVNPSPTHSNSSTFNRPGSMQTIFPQSSNPALLVMTARQRVAKAVAEESDQLGRQSFNGRRFVDALTLQQALTMRDRQKMPRAEIENILRLQPGVMDRLGMEGLVSRV